MNRISFFSPKNWMSLFLYLYVFTLSWSSAFRLHDWLPIYSLFLYVSLVFFCFHALLTPKLKVYKRCNYRKEDLLLIIFILAIGFHAMVFNTSKSFNYFLAYFTTFVVSYLALKPLLSLAFIEKLIRVNTYAILFVAFFCIFDTLMFFLVGFDLQEMMPRSKDASATVLLGTMRRAYGLSTEPTQLSFYLCVFAPLALWDIYHNTQKNYKKYVLYFSICLAFIFTFSASGFAIVTLVVVYFSLFEWRMKKKAMIKISMAVLLLFVVITSNVSLYEIVIDIASGIFDKITFAGDGTSSSQRSDQLELGIDNIANNPLEGVGLGYNSEINQMSSINWYVFLLSEAGLLVSLPILLFMIISTFSVLKDRSVYRRPILFGVLAGEIYLFTVSTFHVPFLWFMLLLHSKVSTRARGRI